MRLAAVFVAFVATGATVLFAPVAHGLALGEIQLQSRLNEPLAATIPLIVANTNEFQSLRVSVATPEAFARAGLQYDDYMGSVVLSLAPASGLTPPRIVVSSNDIAREPFVDLMIEAKSSSGRIIRNYTILLDPPTVPAASVAAGVAPAAPANKPVPAPQPSADYTLDTPSAPAQRAAAEPVDPNTQLPSMSSDDPAYFDSGSGWVDGDPAPAAGQRRPAEASAALATADARTYGPIGKQETLWSIAYRLRPDPSITMDQMQLAIFRANPDAFAGNINRLLSGATLTIPSAASIRAVDAASAKREVARQRSSYVPPEDAEMAPPPATVAADEDVATPPDDLAVDDMDLMAPVEAPELDDEDLYAPVESEPAPATAEAPASTDETLTSDADPAQASSPAIAPATDARPPAANPSASRPMTALERLRAERNGQSAPPQTPAQATSAPPPPPPAIDTQAPDQGGGPADDADAGFDDEATDEGADAAEAAEPPAATADTRESAQDAAPVAAAPAPTSPAPINAPAEPDSGGLPWGLIGGLLLALLLGAAAVLGLRRRKQAASASPSMAAPVAAAASDDEDDSVPDDSKLGDTAVIDEAEYGLGDTTKPAPRQDVVPDVPVIDAPDGGLEEASDESQADPEATAQLSATATPEAAATEPEPPATGGDDEDAMAATMQFDANTISLDLSGDDPISEADVHLAYGATDEAASVMEQAVAAAPDHPGYAAKLAEIYFTANNRDKFLAHVRTAQSALQSGAGDSWQKVLILGQQIAPEDPMFADAGTAELQSADFDFGSDPEDVTDAAADDDLALDLGVEDDDAAPMPDAAGEARDDNSLEFDLGDLDLSESADTDGTEDVAVGDDDTGDSVEFDLGDFDLDEDAEPATPDPAPAADSATQDDGAVEFDLGDLTEAPAGEAVVEDTDSPDTEDGEAIDLGEFELDVGDDGAGDEADDVLGDLSDFDLGGETVADDADVAADADTAALDESSLDALLGGDDLGGDIEADADDITTKLDLARSYAESGDSDLAESLLNDVVDEGDPEQQAAARQLLASLGKPGSDES